MIRYAVAAAALVTLAGCSGSPGPMFSRAQAESALATAAGAAQPSRVVAAEIAFARAAKENGQWTAFREFAAPGAILHTPIGGIDAAPWLVRQTNPAQAVSWGPRAIWMSCDGKLAVSQGRYREPGGEVGTFVTLWQRQQDGSYRWLYDTGTADDPQPPAPDQDEAVDENAIVVTALDAVQGLVADCPGAGNSLPALSQDLEARRTASAGWTAPDGTLAFHWRHAEGKRRFFALWLHEGRWQTALDTAWPASQVN